MPENNSAGSTENMNTALKYIAGRKAAEESLGFLAHIGTTIRTTADPAEVLPAVTTACVPFFGSGISVESPVAAEPVTRSVGDFAAALRVVRSMGPADPDEQIVISDHAGLRSRTDPARLALLREQGGDSAVALPLRYRGVHAGLLVLVRGPQHRRGPLGPGDLALLGEVAGGLAAFAAFADRLSPADR